MEADLGVSAAQPDRRGEVDPGERGPVDVARDGTDVRLTPAGVAVDMSIDGNEKIATNSKAEIHSVSAVGEQFVDFVPPQNSGPTQEPQSCKPPQPSAA